VTRLYHSQVTKQVHDQKKEEFHTRKKKLSLQYRVQSLPERGEALAGLSDHGREEGGKGGVRECTVEVGGWGWGGVAQEKGTSSKSSSAQRSLNACNERNNGDLSAISPPGI
jgi:hypothetical protein